MQSKVNTIVVGSLTKRHDWSKRATTSVCLAQLWCPHIAHSPHSSRPNQPLIQSTSAVPCKFSMSSNCATPTSLPTPLLINLRHGDKKGSKRSLPMPPYSLKTAKATAALKIALNSPKKKQLISLPAVPIEQQQQQHDEASATSSASCVALREARRKYAHITNYPNESQPRLPLPPSHRPIKHSLISPTHSVVQSPKRRINLATVPQPHHHPHLHHRHHRHRHLHCNYHCYHA